MLFLNGLNSSQGAMVVKMIDLRLERLLLVPSELHDSMLIDPSMVLVTV